MPAVPPNPTHSRLALTLGALGVVYGDIGTSPLYAIRECFVGTGFRVEAPEVLGVLSLITWSLITVVAFKYVGVVLRADNQGEGGILALAHLIVPDDIERWTRAQTALVAVGLFGAALLFGDGILTPALSVLSAIEGLAVANPVFEPWVVWITAAILTALFALQRFGTGRVGLIFGPVMLVWFATLAVLGAWQIAAEPGVLAAVNPLYALSFFGRHGVHGTIILGAVFLAVTGAEALYADLGHFGRGPIQVSWFTVAFPGLLLNYYGQGALLLRHPEAVDGVFTRMAPPELQLPLVALATVATIIASQAVISGVFSLTAQAVQLEYFPRAEIRHTSAVHFGQIYVPAANGLLWLGTLGLVLGFRSSSGLADAYGIAVSLTMAITTGLLFVVMRDRWEWPRPLAYGLTAGLLAIDLAFFGSIVRKVASGGWIPLTVALFLVAVMVVWRRGRQLVHRRHPAVSLPDDLAGPLVFLVRDVDQIAIPATDPPAIRVHVRKCHKPFMPFEPHSHLERTPELVHVEATFGFLEDPDVPALLRQLAEDGELEIDPDRATYVLIREVFDTDDPAMHPLLARLYDGLGRLAASVANSLSLPEDRVRELHPDVRSD